MLATGRTARAEKKMARAINKDGNQSNHQFRSQGSVSQFLRSLFRKRQSSAVESIRGSQLRTQDSVMDIFSGMQGLCMQTHRTDVVHNLGFSFGLQELLWCIRERRIKCTAAPIRSQFSRNADRRQEDIVIQNAKKIEKKLDSAPAAIARPLAASVNQMHVPMKEV